MASSYAPPNKTVANLTNQNHLFIFAIEKEMVNIIGHPQGMPLHTKHYTLNSKHEPLQLYPSREQ